MVEHTAHNGKNVGSNPAKPIYSLNKKLETKNILVSTFLFKLKFGLGRI